MMASSCVVNQPALTSDDCESNAVTSHKTLMADAGRIIDNVRNKPTDSLFMNSDTAMFGCQMKQRF